MPSDTAAFGLAMLWQYDQAPWRWETWKNHTRIFHGLCPEDDNHLPSGLSRQEAKDIVSFLDDFSNCPDDVKRRKFWKTSTDDHPGRILFSSLVGKNWRKWGIHDLVCTALRGVDAHPYDVLQGNSITSLENAEWPSSNTYLPLATERVAFSLFGHEPYSHKSTLLPDIYRRPVSVIMQRSWNTLRAKVKTLSKNRNAVKEEAQKALEGMYLSN
jgi:hypothetical protein